MRARALVVWCTALLIVARHGNAQMDSPLSGSGVPQLETTHVYVSVYLDRLINVDEDNYRWEAIHYFYLSWTDYTAWSLVSNQSIALLTDPSSECKFSCSNVAQNVLCCDNLYRPSFAFKNAYGFPQDREALYNLYPAEDGSVLWEVRVHGQYYQPMSFANFPFDSFDLGLALRFFDPTVLIDTTILLGQPHPGVVVMPSSGGKRIYTVGLGDDASSWAVVDVSISSLIVDMGQWFRDYSDVKSDPDDPMPLAPVNSNQTGGVVGEDGEPVNVYTGIPDQLLAVNLRVERFWRSSLINAVLPVVLVFTLGMIVFFTDERSLETRLEIVVTLFLALTAVQFVVVGRIPTSSYVVPTQQLVLTTYIYLFLLATESIVVYHIVCRHEKRLEANKRNEAWRRYCKLRTQGKLEGGNNPTLAASDSGFGGVSSAEEQLRGGCSDDEVVGLGSAAGSKQRHRSSFNCGPCFGSGPQPQAANGEHTAADFMPQVEQRKQPFKLFFRAPQQRSPPERSVTTFRQMTADEAFGQYVGHMVDNISAAILGVGYVIAAVLIFALQNGYIDLFAD
ncbi:hypothetical protein D9Q98_010052 [Chlorella vulgaris]|uniref:Ligand-gated ion channel n=1 Tax=Chlorella vulgaris TaxID=3077 RepID=A0A9D4TMY6_CHLVU|nr:hypothetical protein D9Q98_010052 [Chlorella vulgaris]